MNELQSSVAAPRSGTRLSVLLRLAWPVVLARSTQAVIGFSDVLMVAPLGAASLAAAATGALNAFAIAIFPIGMAFIIQSFSAQLTGAGDAAGARRYGFYGLLLAAATGVLALLAIPLLPAAVRLFGFEPDVEEGMIGYLAIRMLAMGAIVGMEVLGNWFAGRGDTRPHLVAGVIAMVGNVGLNWLLILGHWGFPALGVRGAALASVIAIWLGFGYLALRYAREGAPRSRPRRNEFWRMLRFGAPNGVSWFLEFAAFTVFINVAMAHLGTVPLAAVNVVIQVNSVAFMPAFGLASAGAILVGQARGGGDLAAIFPIARVTALVTGAWQGAVGLAYVALPHLFLVWFSPGGEGELVRVATVMLRVSAIWQVFDALAMVLSEALRALGDTAWCLWVRLGLAWFFFAPVSLAAVFFWDAGAVGALLCMVAYVALLAGVYGWRFHGRAWLAIDLTGKGIV
jgi:MATE family multidrug resistance protein